MALTGPQESRILKRVPNGYRDCQEFVALIQVIVEFPNAATGQMDIATPKQTIFGGPPTQEGDGVLKKCRALNGNGFETGHLKGSSPEFQSCRLSAGSLVEVLAVGIKPTPGNRRFGSGRPNGIERTSRRS